MQLGESRTSVKPTKTGITIKLDVEQAVKLEAVLGALCGKAAELTDGLYDRIADALEDETHDHLEGRTISWALIDAGLYDDVRRLVEDPTA